jgi:superfamily II DNA or RNA helicase
MYKDFIETKKIQIQPSGIEINPDNLPSFLFDFQKDIVKIALKVGKFAIWANTGLGKSAMQLAWASQISNCVNTRVLILAPLGVAKQTVMEGKKFGIDIKYCANQSEVEDGISITNYQRLDNFDASEFGAVVVDESSILKSFDSSTKKQIIDKFRYTKYKLACTATPSPNDLMELANHAEFLGVMSRSEMLAMYFNHDMANTSQWVLKPHAKSDFWQFVSQWAICINHPRDYGYTAEGYDLPKLQFRRHEITDDSYIDIGDKLFAFDAKGLSEQRSLRSNSLNERVAIAAEIANNAKHQVLIWCETNNESKAICKLIPDAVEVEGSDSADHKESAMLGFAEGTVRVLVTKPKLAGFGMNWQSCHEVIYLGVTHSFEQYYQSVRRVWRFGQKNKVIVHIIQHVLEGEIIQNLKRKEIQAKEMNESMLEEMKKTNYSLLKSVTRQSIEYDPSQIIKLPKWLIENEKAL